MAVLLVLRFSHLYNLFKWSHQYLKTKYQIQTDLFIQYMFIECLTGEDTLLSAEKRVVNTADIVFATHEAYILSFRKQW